MAKQVIHDRFNMSDYLQLGTSAGEAPFILTDTSAAGAPTALATADGYALTLENTAEVQNLSVTMGNILRYDIDRLLRVEFLAQMTIGTWDSAIDVAFGVCSNRNDAIDTLAEQALFKSVGSTAIVIETDDGTVDRNDIATGKTWATTVVKRFAIDFSAGVQTVAPPGTSVGGKGNVQFYIDNANSFLERVGAGTLMDMSNYSAGLQLFFQLQKTSDTGVDPTFTMQQMDVWYKSVA